MTNTKTLLYYYSQVDLIRPDSPFKIVLHIIYTVLIPVSILHIVPCLSSFRYDKDKLHLSFKSNFLSNNCTQHSPKYKLIRQYSIYCAFNSYSIKLYVACRGCCHEK
jgi:ABC-type antimicrobial peptide transport system permease subunit